MPSPSQQPVRFADVCKKLIREKIPHVLQNQEMQIFSSMIIALAERIDALGGSNALLSRNVGIVARAVHSMTEPQDAGDAAVDEADGDADEIEGEGTGMTGAATGTAGGGGGGSVKAPQRDERYSQPFPSGVPSSKAEADAKKAAAPAAAAAGPANKTGPVDDIAGEDLTPNVQGTPAVNPQPIPKNPNGKGANA